MVDRLVQSGSITAPDVETAFRAIPRHLFLPDSDPELVYAGDAIPIMHDGLPISSSSEPAIIAAMLEALGASPCQPVPRSRTDHPAPSRSALKAPNA
jgi:protein-L-isoaspartate(D-aspartate) O-methyltransferase